MYQLTNFPDTVRVDHEDGTFSFIPVGVVGNKESDQYAEWLAEGNQPDPVPVPPFNQEAAFARLRAYRTPLLDALSGIAGRLSRAGQAADAAAADAAAQALLDLPTDPTILAATDDESFDDAALQRYRQIAAACPASVQSAFKEAA